MEKKSNLKTGKALSSFLQNYFKKATEILLAFIAKVFWNIYGASIILTLSIALIGLANWLKIPITIPTYAIGIAVFIIIVGILSAQKISKKIRGRLSHSSVLYKGLLWEYDKFVNITGPLCPDCKKPLSISGNGFNEQFENAADVIFGQKPIYVYKCPCGSMFNQSMSPTELVRAVSDLLQEENHQSNNRTN